MKNIVNKFCLSAYNSLFSKLAFTLAETLVVMGIIGVVAALTIPNLNQSTGNKEKVAKLQKIYANLDDAFGRAVATYGSIPKWFVNLGEDDSAEIITANRIGDFLKINKTCLEGESGCFSSGLYKAGSGNTGIPFNKAYLLADGTAVQFFISDNTCTSTNGQISNVCGSITVDIDGPKGVNSYGIDTFMFEISKSGIFPSGGQNTSEGATLESLQSSCFDTRFSCAGWVIANGNMDYLKADAEGVCPNETELSWENTSCK